MKSIIYICLLLFLITAYSCQKKKEVHQSTDNVVTKKAVSVKVVEAEKKVLNDFINLVGISLPEKKINLSSFNGGLVEKLYFEEGDFVRKGDTLAEIDLKLYLVKLKKFFAEFENVKVNYEKDKSLFEQRAITKINYIASQTKYESMKQDIEHIKIIVDRAIIKSPVEGYIIKQAVEENEILAPGQLIYTLNKMDILKIKFELPERDIRFFKI